MEEESIEEEGEEEEEGISCRHDPGASVYYSDISLSLSLSLPGSC